MTVLLRLESKKHGIDLSLHTPYKNFKHFDFRIINDSYYMFNLNLLILSVSIYRHELKAL